MSASSPLSVGSTFGPYRIDAVLGHGGMGVVYRAEDRRLARPVALKLLAEHHAADAHFRDRFLRESRLAAAIEHPGVVPIYEAAAVDGTLYIAMRYVDGRDLGALLTEEGRLDPERAVGIVEQLADALDAAHARGLIHRDVKPSNAIVADERGRELIYLVDFGITRDLGSDESLTETGAMVGTVDYLAPERIRGGTVDGRADVYSLGCVLHQCLTGTVPFPAESDLARIYAHLEHPPPWPSASRPELPTGIDAVVERALAKDPDDRWQTCGELAQAARAALGRTVAAPRPPTRPGPADGVRSDAPSAERPGRSRRPVLAALALLAATAGIVALVSGGGDGTATVAPTGGQVVAIDAATGRISGRLAAGRTPTALARGPGGRLWMVDAEARTLMRLDPESGELETTATGATPVDVAVGAGGLWVANGTPRENSFSLGPHLDVVVRLDPDSHRQWARIAVPGSKEFADSRGVDQQLAASTDAVWVVPVTGSVVRIDARAAAITATSARIQARSVATGRAGVWAISEARAVVSLDPRTAKVRRRIRLPTDLDVLTVGATAAWVTAAGDGRLWRIPGDGTAVPGSVEVGAGVTDVVATPAGVWVTNPGAGTVTQVDPDAMRVVRVIEVGGTPRSLATDGRTVWVASTGTSAVAQRGATGVRSLPSETCEPVVAGNGGRADLLIASDLPLQGDSKLSATQMAQAMQFVLRERRFRAGRFRLAYQSCDDALPATGLFDQARCASNGRAFGRNPDLVAVMGSYNSGCTVSLLPELNRAHGGPVPMISPVNSYSGLTQEADIPGLLGDLYPTGTRNFLRVYPTDDVQGAALAEFARSRGHERAFVLQDGSIGYGDLLAAAFERAAGRRARPAVGLDAAFRPADRRRGPRVVGRARWDPRARSYRTLARRIRATGAQAVLLSGALPSNGARLVRDLRAVLGTDVDLLAPDGFGPPAALLEAVGDRAVGMYLSVNGVAMDRLSPAGRRFVADFARTQPGVEIEQFALYGAQVAETLLNAIARSDGTRASVLRELFRTNDATGLIGPVAFDARGDVRQGAVTIARVTGGGKRGASLASLVGSVVERVIRVAPTAAR